MQENKSGCSVYLLLLFVSIRCGSFLEVYQTLMKILVCTFSLSGWRNLLG